MVPTRAQSSPFDLSPASPPLIPPNLPSSEHCLPSTFCAQILGLFSTNVASSEGLQRPLLETEPRAWLSPPQAPARLEAPADTIAQRRLSSSDRSERSEVSEEQSLPKAEVQISRAFSPTERPLAGGEHTLSPLQARIQRNRGSAFAQAERPKRSPGSLADGEDLSFSGYLRTAHVVGPSLDDNVRTPLTLNSTRNKTPFAQTNGLVRSAAGPLNALKGQVQVPNTFPPRGRLSDVWIACTRTRSAAALCH